MRRWSGVQQPMRLVVLASRIPATMLPFCMPHFSLRTLALAAATGATCLMVWPFVTTGQHPFDLSADALMLIAFALYAGAGLIMVLSTGAHSGQSRK